MRTSVLGCSVARRVSSSGTSGRECLKFVGVRNEHGNRDWQRADILLKLKILVRRNKDIELVGSAAEKFAVLET